MRAVLKMASAFKTRVVGDDAGNCSKWSVAFVPRSRRGIQRAAPVIRIAPKVIKNALDFIELAPFRVASNQLVLMAARAGADFKGHNG